jgi:predicted ATPase
VKIEHLTIEGLHGTFDKTITLDPKISMLVGINGSGKTSILNAISWLLQPSIPHLCSIEFRLIELTFKLDGKKWKIRCEQLDGFLYYHLTHPITPDLKPLRVRLKVKPSLIGTEKEKAEVIKSYSHLSPEEDEALTWRLLQEIPSPRVLGLERKFTDDARRFAISHMKASAVAFRTDSYDAEEESSNPLVHASSLAQHAYGRYRTRMLAINEELRRKIMLSAFDLDSLPSLNSASITRNDLTLNQNQIDALEERIKSFFDESKNKKQKRNSGPHSPNLSQIASQYLQRLKELLKESEGTIQEGASVEIRELLVGQFRKVQKLFQAFEDFASGSNSAKSEIDRYLKTINHFFKDTNKTIFFSERTDELKFGTGLKEAAPLGGKSIQLLSSGEKQIIILLTYIAFSPGSIFIIDEPELSLHPKWQEDFIERIEALIPNHTQLVIATHSPALVGRNYNRCITLLPYNK